MKLACCCLGSILTVAACLDFSPQMQERVQNWTEHIQSTQGGLFANEYWGAGFSGYRVRLHSFSAQSPEGGFGGGHRAGGNQRVRLVLRRGPQPSENAGTPRGASGGGNPQPAPTAGPLGR